MAAASPASGAQSSQVPLPSGDMTCLRAATRRVAAGDCSEVDTIIARLRSVDWGADPAGSICFLDWVSDSRAIKGLMEHMVGKSFLQTLVPALGIPSCSQRVMEVFVQISDARAGPRLLCELEPDLDVVCKHLISYSTPTACDVSGAQFALKALWKLACCVPIRKKVGIIAIAHVAQLRATLDCPAIPSAAKHNLGRLLWALSEEPDLRSDLPILNEALLISLLRSYDTDSVYTALNALSCQILNSPTSKRDFVANMELLTIVVGLTYRCAGCSEAACKCLWDAAADTEAHPVLLAAGVAKAVTEALYSCLPAPALSAAGCCRNLCQSHLGAEALMLSGGIHALLQCISDPVASGPAKFAADALEQACRHDSIRLQIVESGALEQMVKARENCKQEAGKLIGILSGQ